MTLYVHFTSLSCFDKLYRERIELQDIIDRSTGIKWMIKKGADIEFIEKTLKDENIKYDIANGKG